MSELECTIWERSVIVSIIGNVRAASISQVERLLDLKDRFSLNKKEQEVIDEQDDSKAGKVKCIEVDKKDIALLNNFMNNEDIAFPVDQRSLILKEKVQNTKSNLEANDGRRD